jgi:hypothetical protein
LGSGRGDCQPLILGNNEPTGSSIRNLIDGIRQAGAGGNASGKIWDTGIKHGIGFVWDKSGSINVFHDAPPVDGKRKGFSALHLLVLIDFFADVPKIVLVEVVPLQRNDGMGFLVVEEVVVGTIALQVISVLV